MRTSELLAFRQTSNTLHFFYLKLSIPFVIHPVADDANPFLVFQSTFPVPFTGLKLSSVRRTVAVTCVSLAVRFILKEVAVKGILLRTTGGMEGGGASVSRRKVHSMQMSSSRLNTK